MRERARRFQKRSENPLAPLNRCAAGRCRSCIHKRGRGFFPDQTEDRVPVTVSPPLRSIRFRCTARWPRVRGCGCRCPQGCSGQFRRTALAVGRPVRPTMSPRPLWSWWYPDRCQARELAVWTTDGFAASVQNRERFETLQLAILSLGSGDEEASHAGRRDRVLYTLSGANCLIGGTDAGLSHEKLPPCLGPEYGRLPARESNVRGKSTGPRPVEFIRVEPRWVSHVDCWPG